MQKFALVCAIVLLSQQTEARRAPSWTSYYIQSGHAADHAQRGVPQWRRIWWR